MKFTTRKIDSSKYMQDMKVRVEQNLICRRDLGAVFVRQADNGLEVNAEDKEEIWEGIITTSGLDSHNSVVHTEGIDFERFSKNPIVYYDHGWCNNPPDLPIGTALSLDIQSDRIIATFKLARGVQKADDVRKLLEQGILRGLSIGFCPLDVEFVDTQYKDDDGEEYTAEVMHIKSWELLEFSIAGIPSNPSTLMVTDGGRSVDKQVVSYPSERAEAKALVARLLDMKRRGVDDAILSEATMPIVREIHDLELADNIFDEAQALHRIIDLCEQSTGETKEILVAALAVALSE